MPWDNDDDEACRCCQCSARSVQVRPRKTSKKGDPLRWRNREIVESEMQTREHGERDSLNFDFATLKPDQPQT
jgi:hypothetical protein